VAHAPGSLKTIEGRDAWKGQEMVENVASAAFLPVSSSPVVKKKGSRPCAVGFSAGNHESSKGVEKPGPEMNCEKRKKKVRIGRPPDRFGPRIKASEREIGVTVPKRERQESAAKGKCSVGKELTSQKYTAAGKLGFTVLL